MWNPPEEPEDLRAEVRTLRDDVLILRERLAALESLAWKLADQRADRDREGGEPPAGPARGGGRTA